MPLTVTPEEQTTLRKAKAKAKPGRRRKTDQTGKRPGKGKGRGRGRGKGKGKGKKKQGHEEKTPPKSSKIKADGKNGPADHDENTKREKPSRKRKSKLAVDSSVDSKTERVEKNKKAKPTKPSSKDHDKLGDKPANHEDDVKFGCSRCRFAAKGCKTCKNPNFQPRRPRKHDEPARDVD